MSSDDENVSESSQETKAENEEQALIEKMERRKQKKIAKQKEKEQNRKIKKSFKDLLHVSEYGVQSKLVNNDESNQISMKSTIF